jgi:hypothetical protein
MFTLPFTAASFPCIPFEVPEKYSLGNLEEFEVCGWIKVLLCGIEDMGTR